MEEVLNMVIAVASDHRGIKMKEYVKKILRDKKVEVIDLGPNTSDSVDYPEYALKVTDSIFKKEADLGILICGTGIGMSIAANKVKGIRCALVHNKREAMLARLHNDANCMALSSSLSVFKLSKIIDNFTSTKFSNEERHQHRVDMINKIK